MNLECVYYVHTIIFQNPGATQNIAKMTIHLTKIQTSEGIFADPTGRAI
jgi:hypothetical protein